MTKLTFTIELNHDDEKYGPMNALQAKARLSAFRDRGFPEGYRFTKASVQYDEAVTTFQTQTITLDATE